MESLNGCNYMKILHIACGAPYSSIYANLFTELTNQKIDIEVYVPLHHNNSRFDIKGDVSDFPLYSSNIIKPYDKYLYFTKIRRMVKDISRNIELKRVSIIHAHSLFSDGAVAYEMSKKYGIPYIVAIRNTDINKYFRLAIHLRNYAIEILKDAKNIIFLSPSYRENVLEKYVKPQLKSRFLEKHRVLPNGVDKYWLNLSQNNKLLEKDKVRLIFIGRIDTNKNLKTVIQTVNLANINNIDCTLDIVGEGPLKSLFEEENFSNSKVIFHGLIREKSKINDLLENCDILVVPSFNETFGLVYVEAMSRGVPVIYSKNQGFDGFFENGRVGYAVDPSNAKEILHSIELIMGEYRKISEECFLAARLFSWDRIVKEYIELYQ